MAKSKEPWGETTAAMIGAGFGVFVEKFIFANEFPLILGFFFFAAIVLFPWQMKRYYEILGGADERYDSLRQGLTEGGTPTKVYAKWLTIALDRIDAFFGDAGRNDRSWFARMLGLETPGPRWTAPAFDKCLLLALVYPLLTIYAVWIWSGEVGVAEEAVQLIQLSAGHYGLWRGLFGLALVIQTYGFWCMLRGEHFLLWMFVVFAVFVAFAFAGIVGGAVGGVFAFAFAFAFAFVFAGGGGGAFAVALAVALAGVRAVGGGGTIAIAIAAASAITLASALDLIADRSIQRGHRGIFLLLFVPTLLITAFAGAYFLPTLDSWKNSGIFLLVFGVLTLVNAPFDWVAIGLTRALLRRGLAPGGRGPYFYALIDAIVAVLLIMLLAFVTIVAVQTFDDIAVLRAGPQARILPLGPLFEGLEDKPGDPKFWWIWLMLFSTLIPSLFNLVIGAAAFLRGLPFMNNWILSRMPIDKPMRDSERPLVASALAGQLVGGTVISGVLLYLLADYVLPLGLPTLGAYIRDFSETLAEYNAPARLMMWFAGSG